MAPKNPATDRWLTTTEAADVLGLHPDSLRRLRRIGGGPVYSRLGRLVRYRISDLRDFMVERLVANTSEEVCGD